MEVWQATVQDEFGNVVFNPQITVYESDGVTLASIFNEDGSPKENPFTGSLEGFAQFWAGPGVYKIRGANGGQTELWEADLGGLGVAESALVTASDALNRARLTVPDLETLMTGGDEFEIGDVVFTRAEGYSYEVVGGNPDIVTDSGVMLRVSPEAPRMTPQMFGAVGDGVADDTAAWAAFQAATGFKQVPPGTYLVNGETKRFDAGCIGNGEFIDANSAWDQPRGDRERDSIFVHRNEINANTGRVSPIIKTQTETNWEVDSPSPGNSFKHVIGAYHEGTLNGYYNTQTDQNNNFTIFGATARNNMAGMFGSLAGLFYISDGKETENPDIETMGATKNGCLYLQPTRRAKYESGGYMFGLEVIHLNSSDDGQSAIPYLNNDNYSFDSWTACAKLSARSDNAPITTGIMMSGSGTARHGFWNGIVLGASCWSIDSNTQGPEGTVGINMAGWRPSSGYADIGIKFRRANRHLWFNEGAKIHSTHTRFMYPDGNAVVSLDSADGGTSVIQLRTGVTSDADGGTPVVRGRVQATASNTSIDSVSGEVHLRPDNGNTVYAATSARFAPATVDDNTKALGGPGRRWSEVYAGTGAINTSDERAKRDISDIPESVLDAWGDVNWAQYRFRDAYAKKGDAARKHSGLIAQRVIEAFNQRGLDAHEWGLICYDEWDAQDATIEDYQVEVKPAVHERVLVKEATYRVVDDPDNPGQTMTIEDEPAIYEDGDIITPAVTETHRHETAAVDAGSIYGIRYEEALSMEAAYQRRRADRIEARLTALEDLLAG